MHRFYALPNPCDPNKNGLIHNQNHVVYRWDRNDCNVYFSVTKLDNVISAHFSSDKEGLKLMKDAIEECFEFLMDEYKWCEKIAGLVKRESVGRLIEKCGFVKKAYNEEQDIHIYERER